MISFQFGVFKKGKIKSQFSRKIFVLSFELEQVGVGALLDFIPVVLNPRKQGIIGVIKPGKGMTIGMTILSKNACFALKV